MRLYDANLPVSPQSPRCCSSNSNLLKNKKYEIEPVGSTTHIVPSKYIQIKQEETILGKTTTDMQLVPIGKLVLPEAVQMLKIKGDAGKG